MVVIVGLNKERSIFESLRDECSRSPTHNRMVKPASYVPGRPAFVLHIGPSKTATSTLQGDCRNFMDSGVLARDGFLYIGRSSGIYRRTDPRLRWMSLSGLFGPSCIEPYRNGSRGGGLLANSSCSGPYETLVDSYNMNQSVVFSDEMWSYNTHFNEYHLYNESSSEYLPYLREEIFKNWNFHIMVGYRRKYDWLVSAMKEGWSQMCFDEKLEISAWPAQNGTKCSPPLMLPWILRRINTGKDEIVRWYRYVDQTISALRRGGIEPFIWNFHGDTHVTNALFCDVIGNAPHVCNHSRSRANLSHANKKESGLQFYNDIVWHAAVSNIAGLDMVNQTRMETSVKLMHYHQAVLNRTIHDLPMRACPSNARLQVLLNQSLDVEKHLLPDVYNSSHGKDELVENFWSLVNETRVFCSVDGTAVLKGVSTYNQLLTRMDRAGSDWR